MPEAQIERIATHRSEFPADIESALRDVQAQSSAMVEAVCGANPRAKDVSSQFGIHAKLGWQLWNVAYSHPLTASRFLPNEHGIEVWQQAAAKKGIPTDLLAAFADAIDRFRTIIALHAEDREMFDMLLDARGGDPHDDAAIRWRKQAFAGNSFMFGARAKCILNTGILFPSKKPHYFDFVRLHGLVGLVRTRVGVRWPLASLVVENEGEALSPHREPLFKSPIDLKVPLLPDYCSRPLPLVERRKDGQTIYDELLPGPIGLTGANTIFTGEILYEVAPAHGPEGGEVAHFGSGIRTPAELIVVDHIVHKSLFPEAQRELRVYGELISSTTRDDRDRLEVSEALQHLGRGLHRVRTADVPHYAELLSETFQRIQFDPDDFDVFRARLPYPPIPASVMVRHTLPPPPAT